MRRRGVARTEAKGERRREGAEGLGAPGGVGGSSNQNDGGHRGGGGRDGDRNRNQGAQEHEQTRRRRWRRRRPRYGGSVAFAGSRQGNEMPPSQGGRPLGSSAAATAAATTTLSPEPTFLARISRVLLFPGRVAGAVVVVAAAAVTVCRGRASRRDSVELASSTRKRGKGLERCSRERLFREIRRDRGRNAACGEKKYAALPRNLSL